MDSTTEQHSKIKLLEVIIDDKLSFMGYVSNVCKKASGQVGVISRTWNMIPTKAKLETYKSTTPATPDLLSNGMAFLLLIRRTQRGTRTAQEQGLRAVYCSKSATYEELTI